MDAEKPQDGDKPSAKILPFIPHAAPVVDAPTPESSGMAELFEALTAAVNDAPWSKTLQEDREALEDEQTFRRRFGFDANREQRGQIIDFKHQADVTDAEIRILRKSGSLAYRSHGIEILAPAVIAAWGHVQILALSMLMLLPLLMFVLKSQFSWLIFLGILPIDVVLVWLVKLTDDVYIRPHRIRQRVIRQTAASLAKTGQSSGRIM